MRRHGVHLGGMLDAGFGGRHRVILHIDGMVLVAVVFILIIVGVVGVRFLFDFIIIAASWRFIIVINDHVALVVVSLEIDVMVAGRAGRLRRRGQFQTTGQDRRGVHGHFQRLQTGPAEIVVKWRWVQQRVSFGTAR